MNELEQFLLSEMSRKNIDFVVAIVRHNPHLFDELFKMVIRNTEPLSRRAIWALDHCTEQEPGLMIPKVDELFDAYPTFKHDGLKRHCLRILKRHKLPPEKDALMIDLCFKVLNSAEESIALKANAMDILYDFSKKETGLKTELAATIEIQLPNASKGIRNKSLRMLKRLNREIEIEQ